MFRPLKTLRMKEGEQLCTTRVPGYPPQPWARVNGSGSGFTPPQPGPVPESKFRGRGATLNYRPFEAVSCQYYIQPSFLVPLVLRRCPVLHAPFVPSDFIGTINGNRLCSTSAYGGTTTVPVLLHHHLTLVVEDGCGYCLFCVPYGCGYCIFCVPYRCCKGVLCCRYSGGLLFASSQAP